MYHPAVSSLKQILMEQWSLMQNLPLLYLKALIISHKTGTVYLCISRPFMTQKLGQKIALNLYTIHTQRPDQAVREISKTTA